MATAQISSIANTTLTITQAAKLLDYARQCAQVCNVDIGQFRSLLRYRDKVYQRNLTVTKTQIDAVKAQLTGGKRVVGDLEVPIAMPQVESAVAYQTGVFCTSTPIFGVVSDSKGIDAALQFETVLQQQSMRHGWTRELIKTFRDGFKYNFGVATVQWCNQNLQKVVTSTNSSTAGLAALQNYSYGANKIQRISPYTCFMDFRVSPANMHTEGEFFGYNELKSRVNLKRFLQTLDSSKTKNFREAYESEFAGTGVADPSSVMDYYVPNINPYCSLEESTLNGTNWLRWDGSEREGRAINYKDNYIVTHFFCRAMPSEFGANGDIPQIYYAVIVNWKFVVYVERLIAAHDYLPVFIMQPNEDGLGYQTQSLLDNTVSFQDMSSALWNTTLEAKRRQIFDRAIYNPRLIDKKDIDPANSTARIPLRNVNLTKEDVISRAFYQIPFRADDALGGVQLASAVSQMADEATGQNKVTRGQFQKGNKTVPEFETTVNNSNVRQQLSSLIIENQFMTPVKEVIKVNTLQNQAATSILNQEQKKIVEVNPVALREAFLEFQMTDGVLPTEKLLNPELMQVFLQTAQAIPTLMTEYDVMGMFIYWIKLRGAKWVDEFKRNPQAQQDFLQTSRATAMAADPSMELALRQAQNAQQQPAQG